MYMNFLYCFLFLLFQRGKYSTGKMNHSTYIFIYFYILVDVDVDEYKREYLLVVCE